MSGTGLEQLLKPVSPEEALKKFTTNLTQLAKSGKVDPVIGRETEVRRVMQILSRIEEQLVDEVAMRIIENKIKPRDVIRPRVENEKIIL